jgi:hypothetical protein
VAASVSMIAFGFEVAGTGSGQGPSGRRLRVRRWGRGNKSRSQDVGLYAVLHEGVMGLVVGYENVQDLGLTKGRS